MLPGLKWQLQVSNFKIRNIWMKFLTKHGGDFIEYFNVIIVFCHQLSVFKEF